MMNPRANASCAAVLMGALLGGACAAQGPAIVDPAQAGPDFAIQGEYDGALKTAGGEEKVGVQVIALGKGTFRAVLHHGGLPGDGWNKSERESADGATKDGATAIKGSQWTATIKDGTMALTNAAGEAMGTLKKRDRTSPTLGAKPPAGAIVLFDGGNTDQWGQGKLNDEKLLTVPAVTKQAFKDFMLHVEFRTPYMPEARGQARGNSGVYLQRRYELQVLDSFGLKGEDNECGGFYQQKAPSVNMCLPPLTWQTYDIDFTAPRYAETGNTKSSSARVTVRHNGVVVQDNVELTKETPGEQKEANSPGPIYLQNHNNPVRFRNIWLVEKK